jgi:hypothetical protein
VSEAHTVGPGLPEVVGPFSSRASSTKRLHVRAGSVLAKVRSGSVLAVRPVWIPAFAGMTFVRSRSVATLPAIANRSRRAPQARLISSLP